MGEGEQTRHLLSGSKGDGVCCFHREYQDLGKVILLFT